MHTELLAPLRPASRLLARCPAEDINAILHRLADQTLAQQDHLLAQNALDLARMDPADPKYDRLLLDAGRLAAIAADLRRV
ncbi:MAG: gamma-glutamyl-phosphate reductase, partial [Saprospiraceae bacterium]|nr:gamma-glutamyl-phosphate reductase [Saprospiraceae bacterium]